MGVISTFRGEMDFDGCVVHKVQHQRSCFMEHSHERRENFLDPENRRRNLGDVTSALDDPRPLCVSVGCYDDNFCESDEWKHAGGRLSFPERTRGV